MRLFFFILLILCLYDTHAQRDDFAHINFNKADKIAASLKGENLSNLPNLSYKLTADLDSEIEQFRSIYKWVCENIANDYNLYFQNKRKRDRFKNDSLKFTNWNAIFRKKLFRKLLKDQRTICTGYAYLVKELAGFANLECEIVQGYGRVSTTDIENLELPNHSWNAIKLNNKWYLCDPTWASGIPDPESNIFNFNYNDGFFLANPALFAINHFPIEDRWWLMDDRIPTFENFLASPIIYGKAYKNLATHYLPLKMHHIIKETEKVLFRYELQQPISKNDIKFYIDSGYKQWKTEPTHTAIKGKLISLEHQFNKKGFYDVHLYIDEDLISTYTVKVE